MIRPHYYKNIRIEKVPTKKKKKSKYIFYLLSILLIFLLGYFLGKKNINSKKRSSKININQEKTSYLIDKVLVDSKKQILRPIGIIIDNHPESKPQLGLNRAFVVYEFPVEEPYTRFLAIFDQENLPEKIGPIRSLRPYFAKISEEYKALVFHVGGSPQVLQEIKQNKYNIITVNEIGPYGRYFYRSSNRYPPYNAYILKNKILSFLQDYNISNYVKIQAWKFGKMDLSKFRSSFEINIKNFDQNIIWRYDLEKNLYFNWRNGKQFLTEDGQKISVSNIIIQITDIKIIDQIGRKEIRLEGEGRALIFRDGRVINGKWKKEKTKTIFYDQDNKEISLSPGKTWIHIISPYQEIEY